METLCEALGYDVGRVRCGACGCDWIAVRPAQTPTEGLECPSCHQQGETELYDYEMEDTVNE